jgi:hypothetical protein
MARLPARSGGCNTTLINPTREFEDIYDRMGQLVNLAFGDVTPAQLVEMAWVPLAEVSETDEAGDPHRAESQPVHREVAAHVDLARSRRRRPSVHGCSPPATQSSPRPAGAHPPSWWSYARVLGRRR